MGNQVQAGAAPVEDHRGDWAYIRMADLRNLRKFAHKVVTFEQWDDTGWTGDYEELLVELATEAEEILAPTQLASQPGNGQSLQSATDHA